MAGIILLIACIIMYKANRYPDKVPDVFWIKPMIVLSGSMETAIYTGDLVFVKMVDTNTIKENDIIAFRNEENTVTTHRVIEILNENEERHFKTKGDNNNTEDANLVKSSNIEGVYISKISGLGDFLMFMQQPIGLVVMLLIILVIEFGWLYIINKMDEKKYLKEYEMVVLILMVVALYFVSGTYARYTSAFKAENTFQRKVQMSDDTENKTIEEFNQMYGGNNGNLQVQEDGSIVLDQDNPVMVFDKSDKN